MNENKPSYSSNLWLIIGAVLGILVIVWSINYGSSARASVDPSIQQLLDAQTVAWNKGDLPGFMQGYWNSPQLSYSSGNETKHGYQALSDYYEKAYASEGRKMGTLSFSDVDTEMLGADAALVRGRWKVVTGEAPKEGVFSLVMRRFPEGWRIVHDHTSKA